ncbi:MAG: hypothetical protein ABJA70_19945 [Chryseolinea sp.]
MVGSLMLEGCTAEKEDEALIGFWRKDSVYSFYNGFGFMRRDFDEEPLIEYRSGGQLLMKLDKETRLFSYVIDADTLIHQNKGRGEKFIIVKANDKVLVLRRNLSPILSGKNQTRFEIRYFSRIKG